MAKRNHRPPGRPRLSDTDEPVATMILRVAARLFMENGYDATTVDEVANQCQVTKASVYYYYNSKASLFMSALLQMMDNIRMSTRAHLAVETSLRERLQTIAEIRLQYRDTRWDFDTVVREAEPAFSTEQLQEMKHAQAQLMDTLVEAFAASVQQEEIRTADPVFAAHAYVALLESCRARTSEGKLQFPDAKEAAKLVVDTLWQGLTAEHRT